MYLKIEVYIPIKTLGGKGESMKGKGLIGALVLGASLMVGRCIYVISQGTV